MSFQEKLASNKFIVTGEISPPKGTDVKEMLNNAELIKDVVDAINITDNQRAIMRMSSFASCIILKNKGFETVMHLTCRDKNRISLQSELLGAYAHGIKNILVMTGDHPLKGDHTSAKPVYDLDSVQLLGLIQKLNNGFDFEGKKLNGIPKFCKGCVTNIQTNEISLIKLSKKIKMGAEFIQTQAVFDVDEFSKFMNKVKNLNVKIIAGVIPLKSEKSALFMNSNISGIKIPEEIIERIKNSNNPKKCGIKIAGEIVSELKKMCDGVNIMPMGSHENTKEILEIVGI